MGHEKRRVGQAVRQVLVLLGLLAFCFALALPLYADAPMGEVEALRPAAGGAETGRAADVDAFTALGAPGLDIRDAHNRRISRTDLERGLRAGTKATEKRAAQLSEVSGLHTLIAYLERAGLLESALREGGAAAERGTEIFVALPRREKQAPAGVTTWRRPVSSRSAAALSSSLKFTTTPGRVRVLNRRE